MAEGAVPTFSDQVEEFGAAVAELERSLGYREHRADPDRGLSDYASGLREIAITLQFIGDGLDRADESAEERHDRTIDGSELLLDLRLIAQGAAERRERAERNRRADRSRARDGAARTAKKAAVDLLRLIAEIERAR